MYSIAFGSDGSASASSVVGAAGTVDCDGDANADGADTLALMVFYYCCCNLPEFFLSMREPTRNFLPLFHTFPNDCILMLDCSGRLLPIQSNSCFGYLWRL